MKEHSSGVGKVSINSGPVMTGTMKTLDTPLTLQYKIVDEDVRGMSTDMQTQSHLIRIRALPDPILSIMLNAFSTHLRKFPMAGYKCRH